MGLPDLWLADPDQLRDKHVQQIIAFAGSGRLRDGGDASREFRVFLSLVPSDLLSRYAEECLTTKFDASGLALQDIVNEVGRRLGFIVVSGLYRGSPGQIGFDGLWESEEPRAIVVEVKTTDAYRIDLDTVAGYRRSLVQEGRTKEDSSSILMVVGREDTGGLEAQIRGSRHAWDIRLISVDALLRLMTVKEDVEEPLIVRKIRDVLVPQEFTKVDGIIDIIFSTAEDIRQVDELAEEADEERRPRFVPVRFHEACIKRIEARLSRRLLKQSRAKYMSPERSLVVVCSVSREHDPSGVPHYWYAFHPHQKDTLSSAQEAYIAFGCGSEEVILLIPFQDFVPWLDGMNVTQREGRFYWHVIIFNESGRFVLHRKKGQAQVDLTKYLLRGNGSV